MRAVGPFLTSLRENQICWADALGDGYEGQVRWRTLPLALLNQRWEALTLGRCEFWTVLLAYLGQGSGGAICCPEKELGYW